jgi:acyl-CoA synthetase (AMP-forming)/AMP-acid ligase II/uncharacterized membrane protein
MRLEESIIISARPRVIWELVGDLEHAAELTGGITRCTKVTQDEEIGVGTRYRMRMRVGSAEVGGLVELVEYDKGLDLAWTNVLGVEQRGRWRLREIEPGTTRVTSRLSYQSPGGLWGLLADRVSAPEVRSTMRRALEALRDRVEPPPQEPGAARPAPTRLLAHQLHALRVIAGTGVIHPSRPDRLLNAALAVRRWGFSVAGGYAAAAARYPGDLAIIDELGSLTFADEERRSNALANGLAGAGIREGDRVGVMCRNHRGFVESTLALAKLGADALYLNTGFAGPQLVDVLKREDASAVIFDEEFRSLIGVAVPERRQFIAWSDDRRRSSTSLDRLIERSSANEPPPPERVSRMTILTSGTTGAPKGAARPQPRSADPAVSVISRIPLRVRETTLIAAPLFHAWGLANFMLGTLLSSTLVLHRRVEPEAVLRAVEEHRVSVLIAVPVMLRRILDLPDAVRRRHNASSLRIVAVSGSALPGDLALRFMDEFGDVVYNLYGSTEVSWATIATPEDLRAAPGTAGRPPEGTIVKLLDDRGREVRPGNVGRIFVGNEMLFEGYTGGGSKEMVAGLMATGDIGRFDKDGRLFVEGRSDEMIVSGGENVFPAEVEELLGTHPDIAEAAVVGVPDEEWGQRLRAYVVVRGRKQLTPDDVKAYVRSRLARYKVPRDVEFLESLPRSTTGKVLKRELNGNRGGEQAADGKKRAAQRPQGPRGRARKTTTRRRSPS